MYDVYSQLAYALKACDVETVVIGGQLVMRERKLLTVDEPRAMAQAEQYSNAISTSLASLGR